MHKFKITKTILILSIVSLFADMASEMYYVLTPMYLQSMGVSVIAIGTLEGIAEFVAGISKGFFGNWSDAIQKRIPFIKLGYFLSAISKPLIVLNQNILFLFGLRSIDRVGKGLRSAARDALLSNEATTQTKARVFAFHRAFDTIGAIVGPAIVLVFLLFNYCNIKQLFLWGIIPGLLAVMFIFFIKEKQISDTKIKKRPSFFSYFSYWKTASSKYKKFVIAICIFYLCNSSDVFLFLKTKEIIANENAIFFILKAYIIYNIVYAITSFPIGKIADKIEKKWIIVFGLFIYSFVYFSFTIVKSNYTIYILFAFYGLYAATTESVIKAFISNTAPQNEQGAALGLFASLQSLIIMLASFIAGFIWKYYGSQVVFWFSGVGAILIATYFLIEKQENIQ